MKSIFLTLVKAGCRRFTSFIVQYLLSASISQSSSQVLDGNGGSRYIPTTAEGTKVPPSLLPLDCPPPGSEACVLHVTAHGPQSEHGTENRVISHLCRVGQCENQQEKGTHRRLKGGTSRSASAPSPICSADNCPSFDGDQEKDEVDRAPPCLGMNVLEEEPWEGTQGLVMDHTAFISFLHTL